MSRCERCGGKDHTTAGHDEAQKRPYVPPAVTDVDRGQCIEAGCARLALPGHFMCEVHEPAADHERGRLPRAMRGSPYLVPPRREPLNRQSVLPFDRVPESSTTLLAMPQRPFQPLGLMLWDVGTLSLEAVVTGTMPQLTVTFGRVPARWFTVAQSFEQVVKAVAEGKQPGQGWGTWDPLHPGILCRLVFDGPVDGVQALMWGMST